MQHAPNQDGWIEWTGGECPLPDGTKHKVRFRNRREMADASPETWEWKHDGDCDIIAYRVVQQ